MKLTNKHFKKALDGAGLLRPDGTYDEAHPLVLVIRAAVDAQNREKGEPYTAVNQLEDEIQVLSKAKWALDDIEDEAQKGKAARIRARKG